MLSAPSKNPSPEEVAFLQARVARFGLFMATLSGGYWLFRFAHSFVMEEPVEYILEPSFGLHALAWTFMLGVWAATRTGVRSRRFIAVAEGIGLEGACVSYIAMGLFIPLIARPEMIVLSALTVIIVGRAAYVPGTARSTLVLCVGVGIPYLATTYRAYLDIDPVLLAYADEDFTAHELAIGATVNAGAWLALYTALATGIAQVIYGLRREVRDVKKLGQYTLEAKLGEGGMGVVYRAHHGMLRRPTAIKLLKGDATSALAVERFAREVRLTARLTHPNTVTIYDYGRTPEGRFYYAMELLDGAHLGEIVEVDGPQPASRVIKVLAEVASALAEAHAVGLVHRDIKPANIILSCQGGVPDVAKVVDFGLVKDVEQDGDSNLTRDNAITGTPQYMAPEAITSPDGADARSDLYALGVVGYFLLTGTHVFAAKTIVEVCSHHLHTDPEAPSARLGAPVPADLEALLLACLEKKSADRPQNAADLARQLRGLADAGGWRQSDAEAWWKSFGPELAERSREDGDGASPRTVIEVEPRSS